MADNIEIHIGENSIKVPKWATDETAKEMAQYNKASAKALTQILALQDSGNKTVKKNQKLFKELKDATKRDQTETINSERKLNKLRKTHGDALSKANKKLGDAGKTITEVFDKNSLAGVAAAIGGIVGLGAVAGFAVTTMETFAKNIANLTNVGVGLGVSLVDLRQQAAATGLNMEDYGKLVMSNGDALRALGTNAQDGAAKFSALSLAAKTSAQEFNNFGLSNQEYNEYLLEEIEIRRKAGVSQATLTNNVADSLNSLLVETTAMATVTGQDRREMLRNRAELLNNPAVQAARMAAEAEGKELGANFASMSAIFGAGGEIGTQIGNAMAVANTQNRDFRTVNNGAMASMSAMNIGVGAALNDIQAFSKANMDTMDPRRFKAELLTMLAVIPDTVTADEFKGLGLQADRGNEGAIQLINFLGELNGLGKSVTETKATMDNAEQQLRDAALIGLPAAMEEMTNRIKASALTTALDGVGVKVEAGGAELVAALHSISNEFGPGTGLFEGLKNSYLELTDASTKLRDALIGAALAAGAMALFSPGKFVKGLKGLAKGAGGLLGMTGGAAPGAVNAGSKLGMLGTGAKIAAKKAPAVGTVVSAGLGIIDPELREADLDFFQRGVVGIAESVLDVLDLGVNLASAGKKAAGFGGPGFNSGLDMSGALRNEITGNHGRPAIAGFDPTVSSPGHHVPSSLNPGSFIGGITGNNDGSISRGRNSAVPMFNRPTPTVSSRPTRPNIAKSGEELSAVQSQTPMSITGIGTLVTNTDTMATEIRRLNEYLRQNN